MTFGSHSLECLNDQHERCEDDECPCSCHDIIGDDDE